jgi:microcystin-dependent protein
LALNFPDSPAINQVYSDETAGFYYRWDGFVWQSYSPGSSANIQNLDDFSSSFNGITTSFSLTSGGLTVTPLKTSQLVINLGGVVQDPTDDYFINGSNIVFSEAPDFGASFSGISLGPAIPISNLLDGSVVPQDLSTGAPWWLSDYKVGIGTSVPTSLLDVEGNVIILGIATANTFSGQLNAGVSTLTSLRVTGFTTLGVTTTTSLSAEMISIAGASSTIANLLGTVLNYDNIRGITQNITGLSTLTQVTATGIVGTSVTASNLIATNLRVSGITTLGSSNGIGTVTIGTGITALLVDGNARITGILSIGQGTITINGFTNTISGISSVTDATGSYLSIPPGTVISVAASVAPAGYIKANGAEISRSTYGALFGCIGTTFGEGNASTTFNIPDLRGEFIRGWVDDKVGIDTQTAFGRSQEDSFRSHLHTYSFYQGGWNSGTTGNTCLANNLGNTNYSTNSSGGTETRPRNISLLHCIKY